MQIKINLSALEQEIINLSKEEKYEEPKAINKGYELARLIMSTNDSDIEELRCITEKLRETSAETIRTGVNWRIASEANEKIEKIAAQINARKSLVIRAIITKRGNELKINNSTTCTGFTTAAWYIKSQHTLPVSLLIDEILRNNKVDLWAFLGYNKAALGRTDLKNFLTEQGFGCYESAYLPGEKCGFLIIYNKRFKLIAQLQSAKSFIMPLHFRDKSAGREIVFICVKVQYNDDVETALKEIDKFVQKEEFKDKEIILQGDFRAISEKIEEFRVFSSLALCPSRNDEYSFVYPKGHTNKIDHAYISNGLESVKTAYKWDFITEEYYGKITPKDHITIDGLPNHAVMCLEVKYK